MRNISFDNPLWLLLLIPLAIGVLVPFFIAIGRDNKSKSVITSLILHIAILLLVGLAVAGTVITTVMTETHVIVVADVSYSTNQNLDQVDKTIADIQASLPKNSKLGVICFGKDYVLHTELGSEVTSVKDAAVDDTATDITSALEYAATLFGEGVLKRVVLVTDGKETVSEDVTGMVAAVERLVAQDIAIDAIYLNSNLQEGVSEVQLTGVEYTKATYLNHQTTADALVQANTDTRAIVSVYRDGAKLFERAVELTKGYNVVNFELPTDAAGNFSYEIRVAAAEDASAYNNSYSFGQTVSDEIRSLLITSNPADISAIAALYGDKASIDVMLICSDHREFNKAKEQFANHPTVKLDEDPRNVPCSVEELCLYDEIVLSSMDIREVNNVSAFVESVETVVSQYGKSLVTIGDTKIQNKEDSTLESLENMLPVKFGNSAQDPKLYTIVIDVSRSMYTASRLAVAKQAAIHLLNLLSDEDDVAVVTFAGDIKIIQATTKAVNREDIAKKINAIQPSQGTSIGGGLAAALNHIVNQQHSQKQVMLISDGMNYTAEIVKIEDKEMTPVQVAQYMYAHDIYLSTMNPYNNEATGVSMLKNLAAAGNGEYYYIKDESALSELVFSDIADDVTESVVEGETLVHIARPKDDAMKGVSYLPSIMGYVHSKAKISAYTVLTVDYKKASGDIVEVPLYAYWKYGNGKVSSFTGAVSGDWATNWQSTAGQTFMQNVLDVNIPEQKIDYPYSLDVRYDGIYSNIEIIPAVLNPYATVDVTITHPDGTSVTERLTFDASRYFYRFETPVLGRYAISVTYSAPSGTFTSTSDFYISYSPEYDSFANFDASTLHAAIRHRGTVSEGKIPDLSNTDARVATYRLTFTVPFMIAAVALYVIDIIIRKMKWSDIKGLFKRSAAKTK
ncbi:MAG: VWA domain-containing protein [Clostridia bacterium]|nr:VWA domain-containing protein [Clostridia bacterium]